MCILVFRFNKFNVKFVILFLVIFFFVCTVAAHQPRIETGTNSTFDHPIIIKDPELMQAFYGNLNGKSDYYQINSDNPFELCLGINVPVSRGLGGNLPSVQVTDSSGKIVFSLNDTSQWKPFTGEFKDNYLDGPEISRNVSAGTYNIKVSNTNNQGKYLLLVGNMEMVNANDYIQDIINAPILKEQFFAKPVTLLFLGFIGTILAFGTGILLFLITINSGKPPEIAAQVAKKFKPIMCLGIAITSILWAYIMFKYSFSILVIINTLFLITATVFGLIYNYKITKTDTEKITIFIGALMILFWILFIYGAIIII